MCKMTASFVCNLDEKSKVIAFCQMLNVSYTEVRTEKSAFAAFKLRAKKIDIITFFHQAGRQLNTVVPVTSL
jgi:hypothetical protein